MTESHGTIPIYDPRPQDSPLHAALQAAAARVLASGHYVLRAEVSTFERMAAEFLGARHAIGVNSGTDALAISLAALGVGQGDEVITTAFTFFGTAEAISRVGAVPRFVDIDPDTFNLNLGEVEAALNERTRCLLPVHLFGRAMDMTRVTELAQRHRLAVIEDVAQAFGGSHEEQRLGTFGDFGAYSFYPTKNLGGFGDGGLIVTDRDDLAEKARALRNHADRGSGIHSDVGFNSRLDALQAALLKVKLPHVERWNEQRRAVAERYRAALCHEPGLVLPNPTAGEDHVFHQYTIRVQNGRRDFVFRALRRTGIAACIYYSVPLHRQPLYREQHAVLPQADRASDEVISLPIWPEMTKDIQDRVIDALRSALDEAVGAGTAVS